MAFKHFNFNSDLIQGISSMGYKSPTPIQEKSIPIILQGKDIIACAQTGTGKTASFVLPLIQLIISNKKEGVRALIISPTRELALQIDQQIEALAYFCNISSIAIYGGNDGIVWERQAKALRESVEIVTATPGRLLALLQSDSMNLKTIDYLVLDEADRMLDMGFSESLKSIFKYLPEQRQTIMFSATMAPNIRILAAKILKNHETVNIAISKPPASVLQRAYVLFETQKIKILLDILKNLDYTSIIIFASRKDTVKELSNTLHTAKLSVSMFSSELEQAEREEIMRNFKNKKIRILVGTDIISRGIDVDGISLVINYDVPQDPEDYVHRVGRTARAEKNGEAITFVNERDQYMFSQIEALIGIDITKSPIPEFIGSGPAYNPQKPVKTNTTNKLQAKFKHTRNI